MYAVAPAASVRGKYGERRTFENSGWLGTRPTVATRHHGMVAVR